MTMVENRITDGKRIAELLASEVTGLETAVFADLEVVDADRNVVSDESGPVAYRLAHHGDVVGTVHVFPSRIDLSIDREASNGNPAEPKNKATLAVANGASVKDAVDWLRTTLGGKQG